VIANDPDADRCAVALPTPNGWRRLHGDEVGILLADHLMRRGEVGTYATTIVSSSQLGTLCAGRGLPYAETLTGFKWIVRAHGGAELVFGYEEALGYCAAPGLVRDKDGITAALLVAEIAAELRAQGRSLLDRLDDLAAETGVHLTDQLSVRFDALPEIDATMARLRANPVSSLLGEAAETSDLAPQADVLVVRTATARWIVRPSGTEPKIKAYLEVRAQAEGGVPEARRAAAARLEDLASEIRGHLDPA
jgi:phosphomannomutase